MPERIIDRIRNAITSGNYDMTYHALEEMAEDELGIFDVESAVLNGKVIKKKKGDPRGIRYIIKGLGADQTTPIGIVGRFKETGIFLIIQFTELHRA
jgi:Holliday junction resolvasome RuvABC ATP-dependent DNA helicase subunit